MTKRMRTLIFCVISMMSVSPFVALFWQANFGGDGKDILVWSVIIAIVISFLLTVYVLKFLTFIIKYKRNFTFKKFIGDITLWFKRETKALVEGLGVLIQTLIFGAIYLFAFAGWIMNIVTITHADHITGMVALRIISIFIFPVGCVLGYF